MNCRGNKNHNRIVKNYNLSPIIHVGLLNGQENDDDNLSDILSQLRKLSLVIEYESLYGEKYILDTRKIGDWI